MAKPIGRRPAEIEAETLAEQPYNADDPEQVNKARSREGRRARAWLLVVEQIMSGEGGRAGIYDLLFACKVFDNLMVPGDPHGTYFQLGERNIGLRLLMDIQRVAPQQYVLMMQENASRK